MTFSELWDKGRYNQAKVANINVVINGCKDCILHGYDFKNSNNTRCYVMSKDIDIDKLKGYERPNWCPLPLTTPVTIRAHAYATTIKVDAPQATEEVKECKHTWLARAVGTIPTDKNEYFCAKCRIDKSPMEWPKKKKQPEQTSDWKSIDGYNEALDDALKVHQSVVAEKDKEIERLKEFEWKYKELCK